MGAKFSLRLRGAGLAPLLLLASWLWAQAPGPAGPIARGAVVLCAVGGSVIAVPATAEARRFGGGRSFGFRGSRGFSRGLFGRSRSFGRRSYGRRSAFGRGYGYRRPFFGGWGLPFFFGMGWGWGFPFFGGFSLIRMLMIPLILYFVLRMMSGRR